MTKDSNVLIEESLDGIGTERFDNYVGHALCLEGSCLLDYNGSEFKFMPGDLMIVRKGRLVENIRPSEDFKCRVLYVAKPFIELSTPSNNYGLKGSVALFLNPVMHLDSRERFICERDFEWINYRLNQTEHTFYTQLVQNAVQGAILDFFDFHAKQTMACPLSNQNANIFGRFMEMLESGTYRRHREVSYYSNALCITPKYLSEVSKKVSGFPANYWINRYTILDVSRMLRDKSLTFYQISNLFNFSSPAYFSRYVQRNLGMNPSQYRD